MHYVVRFVHDSVCGILFSQLGFYSPLTDTFMTRVFVVLLWVAQFYFDPFEASCKLYLFRPAKLIFIAHTFVTALTTLIMIKN